MRAEFAAGIIAWSFFLTTPFIGEKIYNRYFKEPEKKIAPKTVNKLVERCDSIYPRGLHFVLKNGSEVDYNYGSVASEYICKYIESTEPDTDDKMFEMCIKADKNHDRYINRCETKALYDSLGLYASLLGQR